MTDRFHSLTVVLESNVRKDDAASLISAIEHLRGVLSVSGNVADTASWMAEERAKRELGQKILAVVYPKENK